MNSTLMESLKENAERLAAKFPLNSVVEFVDGGEEGVVVKTGTISVHVRVGDRVLSLGPHQIKPRKEPPVSDDARYVKLVNAVHALYYAAHWTPDRECDTKKLWEDIRDAAGFAPGSSPAKIATHQSLVTALEWLLHEVDDEVRVTKCQTDEMAAARRVARAALTEHGGSK